jgi:putative transposase
VRRRVGARHWVQHSEHTTDISNPNATPSYDRTYTNDNSKITSPRDRAHINSDRLPAKPGVAFGRESLESSPDGLPNAAPLPPRLGVGTVGAIVLNFKSVTTRSCNRIKRSPGRSIWQRNYYVRAASPKEIHIIRSEEALQHIRQYVQNNAIAWQHDQLHPDNPSKW